MNGRTQKTLPGLSQKRQQFRNQALTSRLLSLSTRAAFVFFSFFTVSRAWEFCLPIASVCPAQRLSCHAELGS